MSLTVLGLLITTYLGLCLLLRFGQTRLIFYPSPVVSATPADYDLAYEEVWLAVATGKIHGWWIPASKVQAPVLLYLHGNGSNNGDTVSHAWLFSQLGFSVLLIDYRGYGYSSLAESEAQSDRSFPDETKVYEDAEAAWKYLIHDRGIEPQNLFIYGHSLGGAIGIEMAVRHPEMAGLIVEGTFTSIEAMANTIGYGRWFPLKLLLTQKFDSMGKISSIQVPILLIHGTEDEVVPTVMSEELYNAASLSKQLYLVAGAGHNNVAKVGGETYLKIISHFVESVSGVR